MVYVLLLDALASQALGRKHILSMQFAQTATEHGDMPIKLPLSAYPSPLNRRISGHGSVSKKDRRLACPTLLSFVIKGLIRLRPQISPIPIHRH